MRLRNGLLASVIVLLIACSPHVRADSRSVSVVYPTGVFPDDVSRVQAALDSGGTVILKAVNTAGVPTPFNFGTGPAAGQSSGVNLNKDVSIIGERAHSHRTTILGGFLPILGALPVKSSIRGIDFEGSIWEAITIGASTGSVITDNVIRNVVPVRVRVPSGAIITFAEGIGFSGYDDSGPAPGLITGNVLIAGNTIDGASALFSNGIQFDSFSADVEIAGNTVRNVNDDTTQTGSGIAVIRAQNNVAIIGNFITPGPTQNFGADGIFIGGDSGARYQVIGNWIQCEAAAGDGIDVAGGNATSNTGTVGATVVGNYIRVNGVYAVGIFLWDLVTDARVTANSIEGAGINGLGISTYGFETNIASLNRFVGNTLRGFTASQSDLFYDANTQNNAEIGFCRSVVDLGIGNSSTCQAKTAVSAAGASAPTFAASSTLTGPGASTPSQVLTTKQQQRQGQLALGRIAPDQVVR